MLHELSLRKALRTVMFLMTCFLITGCYTLKTTTYSRIPEKTTFMIVHADENFWPVVNYSVTDGLLTAQLIPYTEKVPRAKTVHVYAAPVSAVTVDGTTLTVPVVNIGKTDYYALNIWETLGLLAGGGWLLYSMIMPLFYSY